MAEYVLEPIGDHLIDPATLLAEETPLDSALQIVDIDKIPTSEGYAVLNSKGLFYHFETDMPGIWNEDCLLPSRAIADNIVIELHEGSFYYNSNQIQFASRYTKQTNDRLALFVIHVTPQLRQLLSSPESDTWLSMIQKERDPAYYSLYCALYLRFLGYSYPFISQMLGTPAGTLYKRCKPYEHSIVHQHQYTEHELMIILELSSLKFNNALEKGVLLAPDGMYTSGINYWNHSTVVRMLKGIQQKYSRANLERLLNLYPLKFDIFLQKGKLPIADGVYSNERRY